METSIAPSTPETRLTAKAYKNERSIKAIGYLRDSGLTVGDTIYVILRHKGKSGTTRYYDFIIVHNKIPQRLTWDISNALDLRYDRHRVAIRIDGEYFGVARKIVRDLAQKLFGRPDELECCILEP